MGFLEAAILMSCLAVAGVVFLNLPRLFLKICRRVWVRMASHCKASGFGGALKANLRAKETLQGSNGGWWWRRMLLGLWVLSGVFLSVWVFLDLKEGNLSFRKEKIADEGKLNALILQEQFNVSKDQAHALATLFSRSDQVLFFHAC